MSDIIRKICGADCNEKWRTQSKKAVITPEPRELAASGFQRSQRLQIISKWGSAKLLFIWLQDLKLWPLIRWTKTLRLICNVTYNINQILHLRWAVPCLLLPQCLCAACNAYLAPASLRWQAGLAVLVLCVHAVCRIHSTLPSISDVSM